MTDRRGGSSAWGPSFHPPPSQATSLCPQQPDHHHSLPTRATHHRRRHVPVGPAGLWFQQEQRGGGAGSTLEAQKQTRVGPDNNHNEEEEEEDVRLPVAAVPTEARKNTTTTLSPAWIKMQCDLGIVTPALPAYWNPVRKACTLRKEPCSYPSRYALLTDILYASSSEQQQSRNHPWKVTKPVLARVHAVSARLGDSALWVVTLVDDETGARMSAWMEPAWVAREQQQPSILQEGFVWLLVGATLLLVDPESDRNGDNDDNDDDDDNHHLERLLLVTPDNVIQSWSPHDIVDDTTYIRWMEGRAALTSQIPQEARDADMVVDGEEVNSGRDERAQTEERELDNRPLQIVPRVASLYPPNQRNTAARAAAQPTSQPAPVNASRRETETSAAPGGSASRNPYARPSSTPGHSLDVSGRHQSSGTNDSSVATLLMQQSQSTFPSSAGIPEEQRGAQAAAATLHRPNPSTLNAPSSFIQASSAVPTLQEPTSGSISSVAAVLMQQSQSSTASSPPPTRSPPLQGSVPSHRETDPRRNMPVPSEPRVGVHSVDHSVEYDRGGRSRMDSSQTGTAPMQRHVQPTTAQPTVAPPHDNNIMSQTGGDGQVTNRFAQFASPTQDPRPAPGSSTKRTTADKENAANMSSKKRPRPTQPPKALWMANDASLLALSDDDDDEEDSNPAADDNVDDETHAVDTSLIDVSQQNTPKEPSHETTTKSQPTISLFQAAEYGALDLSSDDDDDE